jgi:prepilin-type N-terminal cleavage/methylation domain-containing protein
MSSLLRHRQNASTGFTVVELVIVIAVVAIITALVVTSYNSAKNNNMTASGETLASQGALKAKGWYSVYSTWPTLTNLQTTTVAEAKLTDTSAFISWVNGSGTNGASNQNTYKSGKAVVYRLCSNGGMTYYWDYTKNTAANPIGVSFGSGC